VAQEKTGSFPRMKYESIIGLEVHAQLLTDSKIFCGCSTSFGAAPNHSTCPVCAGFPGALPVLNKKVVEFALYAGLAMHCKIAGSSRLARKNYFYPDLPKGYQISQYELPICSNGYIDVDVGGATKRVRLIRIHVEEDAGKNIHDAYEDCSLIDLNRAGVPLLEIVSEPDIRNPGEAVSYLKSLRAILRYLEVCDGNMEEGSFRCDANISVRRIGTESLGTKVEIKNLNSFKAIEKALEYEQTRSMRSKESAHDYRYFPDPDLLPINLNQTWTQKVCSNLPELPEARKGRLMSQYGLSAYDAELLTGRRDVADYLEAAINVCPNAKALSNWIIGDLFRVLKERKLDEQLRISDWPLQPTQLGDLVQLIDDGKINGKIAKVIFEALLDTNQSPRLIMTQQRLEQVSDPASLERSIDQVLITHAQQVAAYRGGNDKIFGFLVGQVMKASQGKANPQKVNELLKAKLS
jgi:aspartyl-tRNA(Asn)/glutamyl-tRNA(Gln) amidotransferase subunit B